MTTVNSLEVDGKLIWIRTDVGLEKSELERLTKNFTKLGAKSVLISGTDFDILSLSDEDLLRIGLKKIKEESNVKG